MKPGNLHRQIAVAAFTMVEVMIAAALSAGLLVAILAGSVALQRSFKATNDYSIARGNQQRVMDYITRDIRGAHTVTVSADNQTLSVTIPDHYSAYDAQGNPIGNRLDPVIKDGQAVYGDPTKPVKVSYFVSDGSMVRQQWWWIGGVEKTGRLVVARDVEDFESNFVDLRSVVTFNVTFAPKYSAARRTANTRREGTRTSASVSVRNVRRD
jgi:hypothetical protein